MGAVDNEMIDRALDNAEAQLEVDEKPEVPEVKESETPAVDETKEAEELANKKAYEEKAKEEKPVEEKRAKKAKSARQVSDQVASDETTEAAQEVAQPGTVATPPIELPSFWSAEEKAVVAKAPREALEIIAAKEAQRNEWAQRVANESERGKAIEARMREVITPYETKLKAQGAKDPFEAVERILAWNDLLTADRDSIKLGISDLMRKNGLTPYDFFEDAENSQQTGPQVDPRVDEALEAAKEAKDELKKWQESQQNTALSSQVETFKDGKDSTGQVRRQFVEMYEPQIARAVSIMRQQNPTLSNEQTLNHAYEFVVGEARKAFNIGAPKLSAPPDTKKAQAAASSVTGAPSSGVPTSKSKLKGANFNERVDSAIDNVFESLGI